MSGSTIIQLQLDISKEKEGLYFDLPFEVPEEVERIDIQYYYKRHAITTAKGVTKSEEINIIDLALSSNHGNYIGGSGSDRTHIWISEYDSSDGYAPVEPIAGTWNIIVGAYKVQDIGVTVTYDITFHRKERKLLKGDCHLHTTGSDGVLTVDELSQLAKTNQLDYIFITDHNNYSHNCALISKEELTIIPGIEWTHFKGHANLLGVERPLYSNYYANTIEEVRERFSEAKENGAFISINHPFDSNCAWKWGLENVEFDCIELWNGIMKYSDIKCIEWWHGELCKGRRLPMIGGSDFHRFHNFSTPGMPTTCVYSMSRGKSDIIKALRQGHSFITFQSNGPFADLRCNNASMGDEIPYEEGLTLDFDFHSVHTYDLIKIYSSTGVEDEITIQQSGSIQFQMNVENKRFYRAELYRTLLPGLPPMLCLITNPIYFYGLGYH